MNQLMRILTYIPRKALKVYQKINPIYILFGLFIVFIVITIIRHNNIITKITNITTNLNNVGMRLSVLDNKDYKSIDKFDQKFDISPYLNELKLFKSLSSNEQYEYLNMDKNTKRLKYKFK